MFRKLNGPKKDEMPPFKDHKHIFTNEMRMKSDVMVQLKSVHFHKQASVCAPQSRQSFVYRENFVVGAEIQVSFLKPA